MLYRKNDAIEIDNEKRCRNNRRDSERGYGLPHVGNRYISVFVVVVGIVLFLINGEDGGMETAMAFVFGAIASVAAGFSGMRAATSANGRTAMAAKNGGNQPH